MNISHSIGSDWFIIGNTISVSKTETKWPMYIVQCTEYTVHNDDKRNNMQKRWNEMRKEREKSLEKEKEKKSKRFWIRPEKRENERERPNYGWVLIVFFFLFSYLKITRCLFIMNCNSTRYLLHSTYTIHEFGWHESKLYTMYTGTKFNLTTTANSNHHNIVIGSRVFSKHFFTTPRFVCFLIWMKLKWDFDLI